MTKCIDCKWFVKLLFQPTVLGRCHAPENLKINYIDYKKTYEREFAGTCREFGLCGHDAKWFKSK